MAFIVGVDIGGTFTDLAVQDETTGEVRVMKVPSTPGDQSVGMMRGLEAMDLAAEEIALILHGTTVATNAVLERKGARCGLIMTEGFRDVIELRRRDRPETYGLKGQFRPLVSRDCRVEVPERTDHHGHVEERPRAEAIRAAAATLLDRGVEVALVSFLNAYANPENERYAREVLEEVWPNPYVIAAAEVLPEIREFERTSTAVLNGYVQPMLDRYLHLLADALRERGYPHEVLLIQSNGGVMSETKARRFPVNTILSGPAAGVNAAARWGAAAGVDNLVTCDVGGTSLDIAVVAGGAPATARELSLEYGIPLRVPMLDIRSVGAGGGSIAWIDRAGMLNIGPESAGAEPGPVCYGQGGTRPTVTDAQLVLGRIDPHNPIGREGRPLDAGAAREAIAQQIGKSLELDAVEAAWAVLEVANHKIAGSIRTLTVEQGLDPRDFTLMPFGGAGPLHVGPLLRELEIARALVPPWPGITSALGCLTADVRHDYVHSVNERLERLDPKALYDAMLGHFAEGRRTIEAEGVRVERIEAAFHADMLYDGQIHEVRTPLPAEPCGRQEIAAAFEAAYAALYGDTVGEHPVRIVNLRTAVTGVRPEAARRPMGAPRGGELRAAQKSERPVYFSGGFVPCPVYDRVRLPLGAAFGGPAIVEQADATTAIDPGLHVRVDEWGNLIVTVGSP